LEKGKQKRNSPKQKSKVIETKGWKWEETLADRKATEANPEKMESNPEKIGSGTEHLEVPKKGLR
jgi:hypothetical protein